MWPQVESLAAARQAGAGEPADSVRAVNALLTQLDALKSYSNVMVCSCVLPVCPAARALSCRPLSGGLGCRLGISACMHASADASLQPLLDSCTSHLMPL